MPIFVYYDDDYTDNGGVGVQEFPNKADAAAFIQARMSRAEVPDINDYTVVEGRALEIKVAEVVTRVLL